MVTGATQPQPAEEKKKRQRSPNYPSVGLKEAIERTEAFMKVNGKAGAAPEIAARHIGFASAHGLAMSVLAALKKFGLMEDKDGRIAPTQRAIEIVSLPKTDERRLKAIREAAVLPQIYADLIEQYRATGLPHDDTLEGELKAYKGFNPNAVKDFLKGFRETLDFAGLSDFTVLSSESGQQEPKFKVGDFVQWESNGVLGLPASRKISGFSDDGQFAFLEGSKTGIPISEVIPAEAPSDDGLKPLPPLARKSEAIRGGANQGATMRQDVFSLTEGEVILRWPTPLSADSIVDLKDWLKIVERKITRSTTQNDQQVESK